MNAIPSIRPRSPGKFASTTYVNEVAAVASGTSPFEGDGDVPLFSPWIQGHPVKITATNGFGQYKVKVGAWKPGAFSPGAQFKIADVSDFSDDVDGKLVNQAENNIATNRISNDTIVIAQLLFIHPDTDLPVLGCNFASAVRFVRQNPTTLNFEYTTVQAADAASVPSDKWIIWATATVCTTTPTATLMQLMMPANYT